MIFSISNADADAIQILICQYADILQQQPPDKRTTRTANTIRRIKIISRKLNAKKLLQQ